jgi:hypothetical protein
VKLSTVHTVDGSVSNILLPCLYISWRTPFSKARHTWETPLGLRNVLRSSSFKNFSFYIKEKRCNLLNHAEFKSHGVRILTLCSSLLKLSLKSISSSRDIKKGTLSFSLFILSISSICSAFSLGGNADATNDLTFQYIGAENIH